MLRFLYHSIISRNLVVFFSLLILVLLANGIILKECPLFMEQAPIYLANQKLHSFLDLLNVYLKPEMFYSHSIPFFRPSGHFLIYQLLTPIFGWHNLRVFFVVNFIFLALTGFMLIKLYNLLFPNLYYGGYIAFALYVSQPALALSRFIIMQFEFSHTFFVLLSLYFFILFTKKNFALNDYLCRGTFTNKVKTLNFSHFSLLFYSILFYFIAITFKEIAIILGPVLACYFILTFLQLIHWPHNVKDFFQNAVFYKILVFLGLVSITFFLYLSLQWIENKHPGMINAYNFIYFPLVLFGFWGPFKHSIFFGPSALPYSLYTQSLWLTSMFALAITIYRISNQKFLNSFQQYKFPLRFLLLATFLFTIIPYTMGNILPWHLLLPLLFLTLSMGFSFEFCLQVFFKIKVKFGLLAMLLLISVVVNLIYVDKQLQLAELQKYPAFLVNRNALWYPPIPKNKLNSDSILVVASHQPKHSSYNKQYVFDNEHLGGAYILGASLSPMKNAKMLASRFNGYFLKPNYLYNGTLFRWAYLMPNLKEMVYEMDINHMQELPDEMIYFWLKHFNNLFLVSYDDQGYWHDLTKPFKTNLLREKRKRHFVIYRYSDNRSYNLSGKTLKFVELPTPNPYRCKLLCDKNKHCTGISVESWLLPGTNQTFYTCELKAKANFALNNKPCQFCKSYLKLSQL